MIRALQMFIVEIESVWFQDQARTVKQEYDQLRQSNGWLYDSHNCNTSATRVIGIVNVT
jgi:hypothetical protein